MHAFFTLKCSVLNPWRVEACAARTVSVKGPLSKAKPLDMLQCITDISPPPVKQNTAEPLSDAISFPTDTRHCAASVRD